MSPAIWLIVLALCTGLFVSAQTPAPTPPTQAEKLVAAQKTFDEAMILFQQGTAESLRAAMPKFKLASDLFRQADATEMQAQALVGVGLVADELGEKSAALESYNQALPLFRLLENKKWEVTTLNNIGLIYSNLDEKQKALAYYNQALPLYKSIGDRRGEAVILNNIGLIYSDFGEKQKALAYYNQALPLYKSIGDRRGEAVMLNNIGLIYSDFGEKQKALDYYNQALPLHKAIGNLSGEALTLSNIGLVYSDLGEKEKALECLNQALSLSKAVDDKRAQATTLNNIGAIYSDWDKKQKALEYFNQALPLFKAVGNRSGEAFTLNNIGLIYSKLDEKQKALKYYNQALSLSSTINDKREEATSLNNIGGVYSDLGEKQKALDYYHQALSLFKAVGNRSGEAIMLYNTMYVWESLNNSRFAVFYGKQSVNLLQELRSNIQGLDKDIQKTYLKSVEQTYRDLADLLIAQGRSAEAQQILNAFKDQQFFDFDQTRQKQLKPLTRTPREDEFVSRYEKTSDALGAIGGKVEELKRKLGNRQPNDEEAKQLQQLEVQLKTASDEFSAVLKQAETDFNQPLSDKDKVGEIADTKEMQTALRNLQSQTGQKAVAIYTLEAQENYRGLLITPDKIVAVSYPIKNAELRQKAVRFLGQLNEVDKQTNAPKSSQAEVQKTGKELYDIVFAPVAAKLEELNLKPDVLMWSLDGALGYIPVATLYDGKQYMGERYRNVVFTRADSERMLAPVSPTWTGSGFYNSKEYSLPVRNPGDGKIKLVGFDKLQNAKSEVETIFGIPPKRGIINGDFLPDEKFTKESLFKALKRNRPLVHIASHFKFEAGDASSSFLLLGDGNKLTLEDIKNTPDDLFKGIELLTLSACETGVQKERESDRREIDGFAELAQRKGARAVLASLWKVDDESTSQLMTQFYQTRETKKLTKAEALQKAQLSLLKSKDFSHPYYWSPFILIGNWR